MKRTTRNVLISALALGIAAWLPTFAISEDAPPPSAEKKHDKPPGAMGQITAIDAKSITIKTMKGETVTISLTATTHYGNKKDPKQLGDFHVGDKVMVAYEKAADGTMTAKMVGTPKKGEGKQKQ